MKIRWIGHACFLITSEKGLRIITDPYKTGFDKSFQYGDVNEQADIVTISHGHGDHNNVSTVIGNPEIVREKGRKTVKGIEFTGISTYHDMNKGAERGLNIVFTFVVDGIRLTHLGDLGHPLSTEQIKEIEGTDILFTPAGGSPPTMELQDAVKLWESVKPRIAIPMHFKTQKCSFPKHTADDVIKIKPDTKKTGTTEITVTRESLPPPTIVLILDHYR